MFNVVYTILMLQIGCTLGMAGVFLTMFTQHIQEKLTKDLYCMHLTLFMCININLN